MAYQAIGRGSVANDGTGDDLRAGAAKVNSNFVEIYTKLGDGTTLTSDSVALLTAGQTLTNKTIDSLNNTITVNLSQATLRGTFAEFNTAMTDANFVTDTGTTTVTNKTINTDSNTITFDLADSNTSLIGTTAQFNSSLSDGSFATLAGTESLTNKTINSNGNSITINLGDSNTTLTGSTTQFNTALSDDNFATLTGSETITNKTIVASNNTITISVGDASDVDITTTAPTDGQVLTWNNSQSKFLPSSAGSSIVLDQSPQLGANLDVNGKTILSASGDIVFNPASDVDFGNNKIKYANLYSQESDLPDVSGGNYHGMVAHVHNTGALYYAHGGVWNKIVTDVSNGPVANYIPPSPTMLFKVNTATTSGYKFTGPGVALSLIHI